VDREGEDKQHREGDESESDAYLFHLIQEYVFIHFFSFFEQYE
jgi:hypothetical protein